MCVNDTVGARCACVCPCPLSIAAFTHLWCGGGPRKCMTALDPPCEIRSCDGATAPPRLLDVLHQERRPSGDAGGFGGRQCLKLIPVASAPADGTPPPGDPLFSPEQRRQLKECLGRALKEAVMLQVSSR